MTRFKKYIDEAVISTKVANYDKKIGDKGSTSSDSIEIIIKDPKFFSKIKEVASKYGLDIERPRKTLEEGDWVKLTGETSDVRQAEEVLKSEGVK